MSTASTSAPPATEPSNQIKFISWNILHSGRIPKYIDGNKPNPEHISVRRQYIFDYLTKENPHIIALQEVTAKSLHYVFNFAKENDYRVVLSTNHLWQGMMTVTLYKGIKYIKDRSYQAKRQFSRPIELVFELDNKRVHLVNVHHPLDLKVTGERFRATRACFQQLKNSEYYVITGDWNCIPGKGADKQLDIARSYGGSFVDTKFVNCDIETTFYGFSQEPERLRGYKDPCILDRTYVSSKLQVTEHVNEHLFFEYEGKQCAYSDHMPIKGLVSIKKK